MLRIPLVNGMRVELAPFDVMVVNMATGSMRSKSWENVDTPTIKEGSLYALVERVEENTSGDLVPMFIGVYKPASQGIHLIGIEFMAIRLVIIRLIGMRLIGMHA
jgi:hypothetical protein